MAKQVAERIPLPNPDALDDVGLEQQVFLAQDVRCNFAIVCAARTQFVWTAAAGNNRTGGKFNLRFAVPTMPGIAHDRAGRILERAEIALPIRGVRGLIGEHFLVQQAVGSIEEGDGHDYPLHHHLSAGQAHEFTSFRAVSEAVDAHLGDGSGKPVPRPVSLGGGKGQRAAWIDGYLPALGIEPVMPSKENEDCSARPVEFDREKCCRRNIAERLIGGLKESRRILFRFEKTAINDGGMLKIALIRQYLKESSG